MNENLAIADLGYLGEPVVTPVKKPPKRRTLTRPNQSEQMQETNRSLATIPSVPVVEHDEGNMDEILGVITDLLFGGGDTTVEFPDGTTITNPDTDAMGQVYKSPDDYYHGNDPYQVNNGQAHK